MTKKSESKKKYIGFSLKGSYFHLSAFVLCIVLYFMIKFNVLSIPEEILEPYGFEFTIFSYNLASLDLLGLYFMIGAFFAFLSRCLTGYFGEMIRCLFSIFILILITTPFGIFKIGFPFLWFEINIRVLFVVLISYNLIQFVLYIVDMRYFLKREKKLRIFKLE